MVLIKEEVRESWVWPLARWACAKECKSIYKDIAASCDSESESDNERAFDIADCLEQGLAREIVTDFMHPLRRSRKLWRFQVDSSEDRLQHQLFTEEGDFLMYAQAFPESRKVHFHLYSPSDDASALFDPARPAFTMSFNESRTEWRLVQEKCEHCQFAPKHLSCACCGKQEVAMIKHCKVRTGDDTFNHMELHVPGLYSDESRVIWCPKLGKGSLGMNHSSDNNESQMLVTKMPVWNDEAQGLVLDFKNRDVLSSPKNFQLTLGRRPDHTICQYAKIGPNTFCLDLRYPLSVIQAFGTSLTTMFWD
jgi:hypothetical protein